MTEIPDLSKFTPPPQQTWGNVLEVARPIWNRAFNTWRLGDENVYWDLTSQLTGAPGGGQMVVYIFSAFMKNPIMKQPPLAWYEVAPTAFEAIDPEFAERIVKGALEGLRSVRSNIINGTN